MVDFQICIDSYKEFKNLWRGYNSGKVSDLDLYFGVIKMKETFLLERDVNKLLSRSIKTKKERGPLLHLFINNSEPTERELKDEFLNLTKLIMNCSISLKEKGGLFSDEEVEQINTYLERVSVLEERLSGLDTSYDY